MSNSTDPNFGAVKKYSTAVFPNMFQKLKIENEWLKVYGFVISCGKDIPGEFLKSNFVSVCFEKGRKRMNIHI